MAFWDPIIDRAAFFSFGAAGYRFRARSFHPLDLEEDLTGQIHVITGANSGIGKATALSLSEMGAHVILVCRDPRRAKSAIEDIRTYHSHGTLEVEVADLSSLQSTRAMAQRLLDKHPKIDALILNAGVLLHKPETTVDGHEKTFATNVLSGFLLTELLLPRLQAAPHSRIIQVASGGMYLQKLELENLETRPAQYHGVRAYAQSKRAQVLLSELWAKKFLVNSPHVTSNAMHPGWVQTPGLEKSLPAFTKKMGRWLRTPEQGADTIVWLAASTPASKENGKFWFDRRPQKTDWLKKTIATDAEKSELWRICEVAAH